MSASVPTGPSDLPDERALYNAQPGAGRTIAALQDALMQAVGFDFLRMHTMPIQIGDWTTDDTGQAAAIVSPHYLRFTPSPLAKYLWAGVSYTAGEHVSTLGAQIIISLYTAAGALVDAGSTWDEGRNLGLYRTAEVVDPVGGAVITTCGAIGGHEGLANTGWVIDPLGVAVKPLDIGANQGVDLVVRLDLREVRAYSLTVVEIHRREI